mmetsp:Transcript_35187/g.92350  ORF Transcript_35187/g.92350 Transcript_35187/m.92350 type:complete len:217 (-) Transcript_35187:62-712(-)
MALAKLLLPHCKRVNKLGCCIHWLNLRLLTCPLSPAQLHATLYTLPRAHSPLRGKAVGSVPPPQILQRPRLPLGVECAWVHRVGALVEGEVVLAEANWLWANQASQWTMTIESDLPTSTRSRYENHVGSSCSCPDARLHHVATVKVQCNQKRPVMCDNNTKSLCTRSCAEVQDVSVAETHMLDFWSRGALTGHQARDARAVVVRLIVVRGSQLPKY